MTEQGHVPEGIDTSRPHPARMYDYYLGGQDNYEVDRVAAEQVMALGEDVRISARANRDFLCRAVRSLAREGVDQFLDLGTGIPTSPNTHEVAQQIDPSARVVYVDNDPIVGVYAGAKLTSADHTGFLLADLRDPKAILDHPTVRGLIDFTRPVGLLMVAVLHFIDDQDDPAGLIGAFGEALPSGSRLVLSHATRDFHPGDGGDGDPGTEIYRAATAQLSLRTASAVLPFFRGFELAEPGLVQASHWRPNGPVASELDRVAIYGGVGVKP